MRYLLAFISALLGTFGFAMLIHAPRRSWISCGLLGGAEYLLYTVLLLWLPSPVALLISCVVANLMVGYLSRRFQIISTVYRALAIVPLVPGYALYRSMALIGSGQNSAGLQAAMETMIAFLMIVLGLWIGNYLFRGISALQRRKRAGRDNMTQEGL